MSKQRDYSVSGVRLSTLPLNEAASVIVQAAVQKRRFAVHLCNTYTLACGLRDKATQLALESSDLNLPDGAPIAALAHMPRIMRPVRGPDLAREVFRQGLPNGVNHFFYGGGTSTAADAAKTLLDEFSGIRIVATVTPPFLEASEFDVEQIARSVERAGADIVWLGLGTPKQDILVARLAEHLQCPIVPIGAAFEFFAGTVAEAPGWLRRSGFEWAFRLMKEPRRLWKRYLVDSPLFLVRLFRSRTRS